MNTDQNLNVVINCFKKLRNSMSDTVNQINQMLEEIENYSTSQVGLKYEEQLYVELCIQYGQKSIPCRIFIDNKEMLFDIKVYDKLIERIIVLVKTKYPSDFCFDGLSVTLEISSNHPELARKKSTDVISHDILCQYPPMIDMIISRFIVKVIPTFVSNLLAIQGEK